MSAEINFGQEPILRGDIFYADLTGVEGIDSEQCKSRPVVVVQNNVGNKYSPTVIVADITSANKKYLPIHLHMMLKEPSIILFEQLRTISKNRLVKRIGEVPHDMMNEFNKKLSLSIGISSPGTTV